MFTEQYKDQVYFADVLATEKESRDIYAEITAILDANNVKHGLLTGTKDYWCRDYMPLQRGYRNFWLFRYHPDYLKGKRQYETSASVVSRNTEALAKPIIFPKTELVADGGNFTVCTSKYGYAVNVMTEKVYVENEPAMEEDLYDSIVEITNTETLMLPWDKEDECGHTDGIVHNIGDGRVLVNLEVYPKEIAIEMRNRLEEYFDVVDLKLSDYHDLSWAYINMLQTRDVIIVPALGLDTDQEAFEQIKALHPDYKDRVYQVNLLKLVKKYGGALNCLSWTVSTQSSKLHHTQELDIRFNALLDKGNKDIDSLTTEEIDFLGQYDTPRLAVENHKLADIYFGF